MIRPHDDAMLELASLRAIDALDADEAALIDAHLEQCAECRAEYRRASTAGAALAFSQSAPPPASLRARVLASAVSVRRIRPWYGSPAIATAFTTAIAAAIVLVISGSWIAHNRSAQSSHWAATCVPARAGCGGDVTASGGVLRLATHGLPALPSGKVYQAWLIHPHAAPIPEPTFVTTSGGSGSVDMQATAGRGDVVAVTIEPAGGSQAPTTHPLVVAAIE